MPRAWVPSSAVLPLQRYSTGWGWPLQSGGPQREAMENTVLFPWPQCINPAGGPYLPSGLPSEEGGEGGRQRGRGGRERTDWGLEPSSSLQGQRVTGTFLSRTPQEVAHKGSQGSPAPGRASLHSLHPILPKGQPHLPGSPLNGWGGGEEEAVPRVN